MLSSNTSAVSGDANYIEDVFSTYLYTGNASTQTINNGIDLAGKGGLVWFKTRTANYGHYLTDSAIGITSYLQSWKTDAAQTGVTTRVTSFNNNGFSLDSNAATNGSTEPMASWTFRKQPKFFDVVTYTGSGVNGRTVAHSLGSTPGCIIVKASSGTSHWSVYHRSIGNTGAVRLNLTGATDTSIYYWNNTDPTSTEFSVANETNSSGVTYVAYIFAHDAGGFGLTGTDNVISCGSFTPDGSGNATINLGWEPQWLLRKTYNDVGDWEIRDSMRDFSMKSSALLYPNYSLAETAGAAPTFIPTATGFKYVNGGTQPILYIAIRRGPMKVPTDGTKVFAPIANSDTTGTKQTTGFVVDLQALAFRASTGAKNWMDRLRGVSTTATNGGVNLQSTNTGAEFAATYTRAWDNTGYQTAGAYADTSIVGWNFQRAPSFFDEVCWTGDGTNPRSLSHNLTVAPTLIITKKRNSTSNWITGYDFAATTYKYFFLNDAGAANPDTYASTPVYGGNPTSSVFIVGNQGNINQSGDTYVSYLFATCPGVSKVGSYTGTGTTKQVDCGFAAGARFVLIKRTDSTGDWYVWDTARGIVSGNDPYLLINSPAAEVTSTDYIDTYSAGFELSSTAPAALNASGGSYIFLAIA